MLGLECLIIVINHPLPDIDHLNHFGYLMMERLLGRRGGHFS